ncbi:MAG: Fic family protein [Anaerolineae bacterium]|nr:Fic family protein [Anaerolineae bacterium]
MDREEFSAEMAEHLVRVREQEVAYWAFVPPALPPLSGALDWADVRLRRALSDADRTLGELAGLGRTIPNPHLLIAPFVRREAVLSSRIEGTRAGIWDVYAYESGQLALPGMPPEEVADVREVANYVRALEFGLEQVVEGQPIGLWLVRGLHAQLLEGVRGEQYHAGEFRSIQNFIGKEDELSKATFVPPPPLQMRQCLEAWARYVSEESAEAPLVRLALIHYQFEAIHPFEDGNGRIGRLLLSLLLVAWDLLPLPLLYLSAFFEERREAYYARLQDVSRRGAWQDWVMFFLQGVADQARDAVFRARELQDLRERWRAELVAEGVAPSVMELVERLFETPIVSAPRVQTLLGVTHRTATKAIQRLERAGILAWIEGSSHPRQYAAGEILQALSG